MSVVDASIRDVIPASVYGFAVNVRYGPYPMDAAGSHRRAVYAVLTPVDRRCTSLLRNAGKTRIMACVPLLPVAAAAIEAGDDDVKERAALTALSFAAPLARRVWESR